MYGFKTPASQPTGKGFTRRGTVTAASPGDEGRDQLQAAASGPVRGPGSGTSDEVKTTVPEGTYIMPADSTRQIGPQKLASLGFRPEQRKSAVETAPSLGFRGRTERVEAAEEAAEARPGLGFRLSKEAAEVPVNLSNGEFKLSPGQVHAIGVQALEELKEATHTPVEKYEQAEPGEGEVQQPSRDELYFADGGLVEEPKRSPFAYDPNAKPYGANPTNVYGASPTTQAQANGLNPRTLSANEVAQANGAATPAAKPQPAEPRGFASTMGAGYLGTLDKVTGGAFGFNDRTSAIRGKNREGLIAEPETAIASPAPASPHTPGATALPGSPAAAINSTNSAEQKEAHAADSTPAGTPTSVSGVQRINQPGQSPLFTNIGTSGAGGGSAPAQPAGFSPRGANQTPDVMGILQRESKIRSEMAPLRDQIAFNSGAGGAFRKLGTDEIVRDMLANGSSGDKSTALGFMAGGRDADMRQQREQQELALRQQEVEGRQDLAGQDLGIKREAQGFQTRAAKRQEELQARYEAAKTQEERAAIAQQIRDLSGKVESAKDSFMAVGGGQEWDPQANAMRNVPQRLVDLRTGREVAGGQERQHLPLPTDKAKLVSGQTYQTARGPARWDGKQFTGL